jgi:hypothetical protein
MSISFNERGVALNFMRDLTGKRFGKLVAQSFAGRGSSHAVLWFCICDCGQTTVKRDCNLLSGRTKSCGCHGVQHGHTTKDGYSPTYTTWRCMKIRCLNPEHDKYKFYGGRGIAICDRWINSFENFLADMGPRPEGATIDRINPDGDYEPGNCRWATWDEQKRNKRGYVQTANQMERVPVPVV